MELIDKIVSLAKRRGFIFQSSEIYGGLANTWDYGPLGVELANNIKQLWWKRFVQDREDVVGISSAILMNPKVWQVSGHLKGFTDPLVECKKCHQRFREDQIPGAGTVADFQSDAFRECIWGGKHKFTEAREFNLMFRTFVGPVEDTNSTVYLRPETAQGTFVNFENAQRTTRLKLPFGIAQIGKAFRNEITPGNFIFRVLEFEQMEIEYFIREEDWRKYFDYWQEQMQHWILDIGIKKENFAVREHKKSELSHYSKKTIDFEYKYPFGQKELYGLAYRTDFDLRAHKLSYEDMIPHVIEPSFGLERTVLAILCDGYHEDNGRIVLRLTPALAPYKAAVFPLLANKPELVQKAREVFALLQKDFPTAWDSRGNIGKRYYSQDEIGTPFCVTIDFETLKDKAVTVRERDTMEQERVKVEEVGEYVRGKIQ